MQIVALGDNLHEVSDPIFYGKLRKHIINLLSVESAHALVNVKYFLL